MLNNSNFISFNNLSDCNAISHFSATCKGGVSRNNYSSLNFSLNSGDNTEYVMENRKRLCNFFHISPDKLFIPNQIHNDHIEVIDELFLKLPKKEQEIALNDTDALITNCKGIIIGILTADCVPIILYDPIQNIIASIHSGWRGTVKKIAQKTLDKMVSHFSCKPENILAGIGPSISSNHFEVGDEVIEEFIKYNFPTKNIAHMNPLTHKYHIDLKKTNQILLKEMGVLNKNIEISHFCTFANSDLFFSARRLGIKSGRTLTGGMLN